MKKFLVLLFAMISLLTLSLGKAESVSAEAYDIAWVNYNAYSTHNILRGSVDIPVGAEGVKFQVPVSIYHTDSVGGIDAEIFFYDESDVLIDSVDWVVYYGYDMSAEIDIYFEFHGVYGASSMEIFIPQTYGSPPSGYLDAIDSGDTISFYFDSPSNQPVYFIIGSVVERYIYKLSSLAIYPSNGIEGVKLYFSDYPIILSQLYLGFTYKSHIVLYDASDTILDTLYIEDMTLSENGYNVVPSYTGYSASDVTYFKMVLYTFIGGHDMGVDYANSVIRYGYDLDTYTAIFYNSDGTIFDSQSVIRGYAPNEPVGSPIIEAGYSFMYWVDINGIRYDFSAVTDDMTISNVASFYPYRYGGEDIDFSLAPNTTYDSGDNLTILASSLGVKTQLAFSVVFVVIIIAGAVVFTKMRLPAIGVLLILSVITFFFMFMNYIHNSIGVLALILIGVGFTFVLGGGVAHE